jgi:flagellar hook-length control protein FliK
MPRLSDSSVEFEGLGQSGKTCPVTVLALHWAWPQPVALSRMLYPMDANLSFLTTPTASPAVNGAMPAAVSGDAPPGSSSFAEVLTGEMFKAQRQAVAAPTLDTLGLQVLPLGNSLSIITSDAPLPDMASLAVFARSQGLDEAAVQALFGLPAASETAIKPSAVSLADLEQLLMTKPAGVPATDPLALAQASATLVSLQIGTPLVASVASLNSTPASAATAVTSALSPAAHVATTASALMAMGATEKLMPLQAKAWIQAAPLEPVVSAAATVAASTALSATDKTMQSALRMTLSPADQDITKRLAQMSGNNQQSSWSALVAASALHSNESTKGAVWETLQLDVPEGLDLEATMNTPTNSPAETPAGNAPLASGAAPTGATLKGEAPNPQALAEQRAAQYQQLADKLGQAVAQRLMGQIERGQWKMEMRMQPASLGHIHIELDMRAGGLDALFSTDNNLTRELLTQGSAKLKDTLSQSGMEVASVWVNGDGSRKSGGNPTPGRNPKDAPGDVVREIEAEKTVAAPARAESTATTGLNVLA